MLLEQVEDEEPSSSREEGPMKAENKREKLRTKLKEARNGPGVLFRQMETPHRWNDSDVE